MIELSLKWKELQSKIAEKRAEVEGLEGRILFLPREIEIITQGIKGSEREINSLLSQQADGKSIDEEKLSLHQKSLASGRGVLATKEQELTELPDVLNLKRIEFIRLDKDAEVLKRELWGAIAEEFGGLIPNAVKVIVSHLWAVKNLLGENDYNTFITDLFPPMDSGEVVKIQEELYKKYFE